MKRTFHFLLFGVISTSFGEDLVEGVIRMDSLGNTNMRKTVRYKREGVQYEGYRSRLGTQLHPYCLKLADEKLGIKPSKLKELFDQTLSSAAQSMSSCIKRYPWLSGKRGSDVNWAREWASHMRRAVVTCTDKWNVNYSALAYRERALPGVPREGKKGLFNNLQLAKRFTRVQGHRGVIALSPAALQSMGTNEGVGRFIHEFFHFTKANNNDAARHNEIERKYNIKKKLCEEEGALDDRVIFLKSLCHLSDGLHEKKYVNNELSQLILACGSKRCEKTMRSEYKSKAAKFLSKGMNSQSAQKMCKQIEDEVICNQAVQFIHNQNGEIRFKGLLDELQKYYKMIIDKVYLSRPSDKRKILKKTLDRPSISNAYIAAKSEEQCWKEFFISDLDGSILPRTTRTGWGRGSFLSGSRWGGKIELAMRAIDHSHSLYDKVITKTDGEGDIYTREFKHFSQQLFPNFKAIEKNCSVSQLKKIMNFIVKVDKYHSRFSRSKILKVLFEQVPKKIAGTIPKEAGDQLVLSHKYEENFLLKLEETLNNVHDPALELFNKSFYEAMLKEWKRVSPVASPHFCVERRNLARVMGILNYGLDSYLTPGQKACLIRFE